MKRPLIDIPKGSKPERIWFLAEPATRLHHTEGYWLIFRKSIFDLTEDFVFGFMVNGQKYTIVIRRGFLFDFASTPKILHIFYPPNDQQWGRSSLVHDMTFRTELFVRWFNNLLLSGGMAACGAPRKRQRVFHLGVTLFGWLAYGDHTEENVKHCREFIDITIDEAA